MSETAERIRTVIAKALSCDPEKITGSASLVDDLGADSLDLAELAIAIQEAFSVELTDEDLQGIKTVEDIYKALNKHGVQG